MTKIIATYAAQSCWDLDEVCDDLEITKDSIVDYYIKYDTLFLTYKDADGDECEEEVRPNVYSVIDNDFKHPDEVTEELTEGLQ